MKHLLKLQDLSKKEILDILNLADQLKYENHNGIKHHYLEGKTLGMIFQKSSIHHLRLPDLRLPAAVF